MSGDSIIEWRESAVVPNNMFPEYEDIAVATCREYATCDYFWKGETKDPLISATCENVNGSEDNCDRLKFHCPEGFKSNVDHATCERIPETVGSKFSKWSGKWKFPESGQTHADIACKEDNDFTDKNPLTTAKPTSETIFEPETKLCEDLDDHFFDETVDVSNNFYCNLIAINSNIFLFEVDCETNNSVCTYSCKVGSVIDNITIISV